MAAGRDQRGSGTIEIAVGMIAILLGAAAGVWLVLLVTLQVRVVDTASEIARQEARGDRAAIARAEAEAPVGASINRGREGGLATVTVRLAARPLAALPAVPLTSTARVLLEPGE